MPGSCRTGYQYNIRANLMMSTRNVPIAQRAGSLVLNQDQRVLVLMKNLHKSCEWGHEPPMRFHNERVFLFGE